MLKLSFHNMRYTDFISPAKNGFLQIGEAFLVFPALKTPGQADEIAGIQCFRHMSVIAPEDAGNDGLVPGLGRNAQGDVRDLASQRRGADGRFVLQDAIIDELVDRFKYLKINIRNSQGKLLILVKDAKQAETIRKAINDLYDSPDNTDIITSMYDIQVINNDIKFQGQEIWEDIQSWNNLRLEGLGISNSGLFNKKERTIEKEISNTGTSTDAILQQGLDSRKLFIRQIKELFADDEDFKRDFANINVELNQDNEDLKPTMDDSENMKESGVNDNVE